MLIEQVEAIQTEVGGSCRQVLEAAGLSWATFSRWKARQRNEEVLVQAPGPKKQVQLNLHGLFAEVEQMAHRRHRTFGTKALYEGHRQEISRRGLQKLVNLERCRLKAERRARLRRITWHVPGLVWAMDSTRIRSMDLEQVQDLASHYKFEPLVAVALNGEQVAEHLERIITLYGPPLILKRDRGSNLRDQAVQAVLEKYLIVALDSPRQYPPYNGAIERAQREIKELLEEGPSLVEVALTNHRAAAHSLNHRRRPCLQGRTACAVFQESREAMSIYTRPKRKEVIDWIRNKAQDILHANGSSRADARDAAWRRAVESWLHQHGAITVEVDGNVLPCFP